MREDNLNELRRKLEAPEPVMPEFKMTALPERDEQTEMMLARILNEMKESEKAQEELEAESAQTRVKFLEEQAKQDEEERQKYLAEIEEIKKCDIKDSNLTEEQIEEIVQ